MSDLAAARRARVMMTTSTALFIIAIYLLVQNTHSVASWLLLVVSAVNAWASYGRMKKSQV